MAPPRTAAATRMRSRRADLKRAIAAAPTLALSVLRDHDPRWVVPAADMKVGDIVGAVAGVGPATVAEILGDTPGPAPKLATPQTPLEAITLSRRARIADRLEEVI